MSNQIICVPHGSRRRSKWYVHWKRKKHITVWVALVLTLVVVLGVAVVKFLRHQQKEEETTWFGDQKVTINPKFKKDQ
jgi:hypothetical protein